MSATSPNGDIHPGTIVVEDQIDGTTSTDRADEVPETIAWVRVGDQFAAVVRIIVSGEPGARRFTKIGVDGEMLETTSQ